MDIEPGATNVLSDAEIIAEFARHHAGYSSDEAMVQQRTRSAIARGWQRRAGQDLSASQRRDLWWRLLNLRKRGRLDVPTTRRGPRPTVAVFPVAEIAARTVMDRHVVTSDELLVDDRLHREMIDEAKRLQPTIDGDMVGRAVLSLRKRRTLRPELVLKVADWHRRIETYSLEDLRAKLSRSDIHDGPGIYLFRCPAGYLYIGEASNLSRRLRQHLDGSDRDGLADHLATASGATSVELHAFPKDSPARRLAVRRAYESELIRSRHPRYNLRP